MLMSTISGKSQKGWRAWERGGGLKLGGPVPSGPPILLGSLDPTNPHHKPRPSRPPPAAPPSHLAPVKPRPLLSITPLSTPPSPKSPTPPLLNLTSLCLWVPSLSRAPSQLHTPTPSLPPLRSPDPSPPSN